MSTTDLQSLVLRLAQEVSRLTDALTPWIGTEEMCRRYDCTTKTLTAMEKRGDIPTRTRGRWSRSELQQWEQRRGG